MADRANTSYSTFFACLHDEKEPLGHLGRGTHYSVCRAITSFGPDLMLLERPSVHDFAIIWDEDHDTRVIPVVEGLLLEGLLSPVLFVGERKGNLTVVVDEALFEHSPVDEQEYVNRVEKICEQFSGGDYWPSQVLTATRAEELLVVPDTGGLINDRSEKVVAYLNGIHAVWNLGVRPGRPSVVAD